MSIQDYTDKAKEEIGSWHLLRKFLILAGIVAFCFLVWGLILVYYNFSSGSRSGIVRKLSHKGYIFKTWEGELDMTNYATMGANNIWYFSVCEGETEVIKQLQDAEANHKRVSLYYKQKLRKFAWRGETEYFIDKVIIASGGN
ncbi:MAG: hypothetical protein RIS64_3557 [Bacteroidota bacterium]|jgi:hypothetical protein